MLHAPELGFWDHFLWGKEPDHVEQALADPLVVEMAFHRFLERRDFGGFVNVDVGVEGLTLSGPLLDRRIMRVHACKIED
jgi:hypothetical protein